MIAVRFAISNPEKSSERENYFEDHKKYLRSSGFDIIHSGPLLEETGSGQGALVVAKVVNLEDMRRFSENDPFVRNGVYGVVKIYEWTPTIGSLASL